MIVKLHGTSGSGKSTVAGYLMNRSKRWDEEPKGYKLLDWSPPLFILGRYHSQCGGCDTLKAEEQIELLHKYASQGHVFYEGLLASEYYGKLGEASERYGDSHIFAFLDTPIELCIERIKARRLAKGNEKPFNETNTRNRVEKINKFRRKLERMGRKVVVIDHTRAGEQVYDLFRTA